MFGTVWRAKGWRAAAKQPCSRGAVRGSHRLIRAGACLSAPQLLQAVTPVMARRGRR